MAASAYDLERSADALGIGGLVVLSLGALDLGLEQSMIVPALPALAEHYGASVLATAWLGTAFLLVASVAAPLFGRLGDLVGKKRLLLVSLGAFMLGSLLCAVAQSVGLAIAGRAVQGAGGAVAPLALGLARDIVPRERLARAIGILVGAANLGVALGYLLSGVLVDTFSPGAIFWFLLGFGALLTVGVVGYVPEASAREHGDVDVLGAVLLGGGIVALLLAISKGDAWGWSSYAVVGLFIAAGVALAAFAIVERRVRSPLIDLATVLRRPFRDAGLCALVFGLAFVPAVYLVAQIAGAPTSTGYGLGLSTTQIGLLLFPASICGFGGSWLAGHVVERVGPGILVVAGSLLAGAAYLLLAASHDTVAMLLVASAAVGVGTGLIPTSFYSVILHRIDPARSSATVSMPFVVRNVGASVGLTTAFVVVTSVTAVGGLPADDGYTRGFLFLAATTSLVAVAGLRLRPTR
jgi:MFS family permease